MQGPFILVRCRKPQPQNELKSHLKAVTQATEFLYRHKSAIVDTERSWAFGEIARTKNSV